MIRRRLLIITGGAAVYPLLVLFGLNAVDELDRTAFAVLLPNIRDEFGLDLTGILTLIAVVAFGALLLQVPIASLADRYNRVRIAWIGAVVWGCFSLLTGLATTLVVSRRRTRPARWRRSRPSFRWSARAAASQV